MFVGKISYSSHEAQDDFVKNKNDYSPA